MIQMAKYGMRCITVMIKVTVANMPCISLRTCFALERHPRTKSNHSEVGNAQFPTERLLLPDLTFRKLVLKAKL